MKLEMACSAVEIQRLFELRVFRLRLYALLVESERLLVPLGAKVLVALILEILSDLIRRAIVRESLQRLERRVFLRRQIPHKERHAIELLHLVLQAGMARWLGRSDRLGRHGGRVQEWRCLWEPRRPFPPTGHGMRIVSAPCR